MGTNYYWYPVVPEACPACGHREKLDHIHIGKSSRGWCFALHVGEHAFSLEQWVEKMADGVIRDDYRGEFTRDQMIDIITSRSFESSSRSAEWYSQNNAEPGPNGLARRRIDGSFCIGHGTGTWDLCIGDFT